MIPNITTGGDTAGLMRYLIGPGKANEHTNPHVVAGTLNVTYSWAHLPTLETFDAPSLAASVDTQMRVNEQKPQGVRRQWNPEAQRVESAGTGPNHVWHCSLSLRAEEGQLTDTQWANIAEDFVKEMGIADGDIRTDCNWVAIRHGLSAGGNDHIHIVVNKVQADGHAWKNYRDYQRAQKACNTLEVAHNLEVLESRTQGRGAIHDTANEYNTARSNGDTETYRAKLEARIRAAATAASSEPDFIQQLHSVGVRVRPYFAKGRTDIINGYSVALHDHELPDGITSPWRAGSKISKDLGLKTLRTRWVDTPETATQAAQAWRNVWHSNTTAWKQRPLTDGEASAQQNAARVFSDQLKRVNPTNPEALANASADIAGALAAIAANPDAGRVAWEIRKLSRQVAYDAQLNMRTATKDHRPDATIVATRLLMTALAHNHPAARQGLLVASVVELVVELAALYKAANQARTAALLEANAARTLASVQTGYQLHTGQGGDHAPVSELSTHHRVEEPVMTQDDIDALWLQPSNNEVPDDTTQPRQHSNKPQVEDRPEVEEPVMTQDDIDALWLQPPPQEEQEVDHMEPTSSGNPEVLDTLNPTGSVHVNYDAATRATQPLAENMVPLSQTQGIQDSEPVTIYRGVPTSGQQINPGDYVTTNKHLAADYAGNGHVIQMDVPAGHVLDDQNEPLGEEYIYRPDLPTSPQTQAENTEATDTANVDEYASDVREVIPEQTQREKLQAWAKEQITAGYNPNYVMSTLNIELAKLATKGQRAEWNPVTTTPPDTNRHTRDSGHTL